MFGQVEIPYGAYWSTPFARGQGTFRHLHAMKFAAQRALAEGGMAFDDLDAIKTHNPFAVNDIVFARENRRIAR